MTNFSEELRKIVELVYKAGLRSYYSSVYVDRKEIIDQAISAITELVERIVPEEKEYEYDYERGFNSCRTEMLRKINE